MVMLVNVLSPAAAALVIDPTTPTTLFVCLNDGIFKSSDRGTTWTASNDGLGDASALTVVLDPLTPTTLYAVAGDSGIFKSIDSGAHWTVIYHGLGEIPILTLAIDPQTPKVLYAGTNSGGVVKSTDGGQSWTAINRGLTTGASRLVRILVIDPVTPTTLYAGTNGGVYKSTDSGTIWTAMNKGFSGIADESDVYLPMVSHLVIDPVTHSTLYAAANTNAGGIFKSIDGGASWTGPSRGWPENYGVDALVIDPMSPTTLYAAIYMAGVFKSTDDGLHWTAINSGLPRYSESRVETTSLYVTRLAIDPNNPTILYALASSNGGDGVFKSTNAGITWTYSNLGVSGAATAPR